MKKLIFTILFCSFCITSYALDWNEDYLRNCNITDGVNDLSIDTDGKIGVTLDEPIATDTTITGTVNIVQYDASGNAIESHQSADGGYHLGVQIEQNVIADPNNSSDENLSASGTFTGTATSTLGVVGLQVSLKTDQNCTVYVDQSPDGVNWDISDSYTYYTAINNFGVTVQAINSYVRVRVTNNGASDTTYFRLQLAMCPIVEAVPRSLTAMGRLKTECSSIDEETGIKEKVTPFGIQKSCTPIRMIGTSFSGTTKDTSFWTEDVSGSGNVSQSGEIILSTGTTANSTAKYTTVRKARHVAGCANELKFTGRLSTEAQANNIRRLGVYDSSDGFFFQVNGTTFGVGSRKGGVDTIVNSGSFNGNLGNTLSMNTTMGNFVIWYWERAAYFFINGSLLHIIRSTTASLVNTMTLPITMENINSNGNTTNNAFEVLVASVCRFGELKTNPQTYYHATGQTAGVNLKVGAGAIHGIIISNVANNSVITLSDSTTTTTPTLWALTSAAQTQPVYLGMSGMPFNNGLRLTVATANASVVVIYE